MKPRWTWTDPSTGAVWEMPRNPNKMTTPHPPRNSVIFAKASISSVGTPGGVSRVLAFRQQPHEWAFSGAIRDPEHYTTFRSWIRKTGRLHIKDHLGRTWEVRIDSVELDELRPTPRRSHRFNYTVHTIMYGQIS